MDTYNKFFINLLDNSEFGNKDLSKKNKKQVFKKIPSYDLIIQRYILDFLINFCLPVLRNKDFLTKKDIGLVKKYNHIPILQNSAAPKTDILLVYDLFLDDEDKRKSLIFDLAVSFLMLFNKSCSRLVYGSCFDKIKTLFNKPEYQI
jgi:hypothetical protein